MKKDTYVWAVIVVTINALAMLYILVGYSDLRTKSTRELAEKSEYISELEQEVADRDAQILSLNNRIYQYELEVQTLQDSLNTATDAKITLASRCLNLETQLADVTNDVENLEGLYEGYLGESEKFLLDYERNGGKIEEIGNWYCTAYCCEKRAHICGTGTGITASGEPVEAFVSVAINKSNLSWLPFGTHLYIEGVGERVIMDVGGGVNKTQIDCAVDTHQNALSWDGVGYHRVWVLK